LGDYRGALRYVLSRLYSASEFVVFERSIDARRPDIPPGIRICRAAPEQAEQFRTDLLASGAREEIAHFRRGAAAYLLYEGDRPVASGWMMLLPRRLAAAGYGESTAYLGGFVVRPERRGHGLFGLLLRSMCADASKTCSLALLETSIDNSSSQRGALKAGFVRVGLIRATLILGRPLSVRLTDRVDG